MEGETIWGERVGIRSLRITDAARLRQFMRDPQVVNLVFEELDVETPTVLGLAFLIYVARLSRRPEYAIVDQSDRLIGHVRLWRISERNRTAMLSIFIGEESNWGKGYGAQALRLVLEEAFGPLGLRRIELHVFDFNRRAIRCYEKVGFVREGTRRFALTRGRTHHDIVVMGVLKEEFFAGVQRLTAGVPLAAELSPG